MDWRHGIAAACACLASAGAWAQGAPLDLVLADERTEPQVRLEVNSTSLPRFDGQDAGSQAQRVDFAVLPASGSGVGVAVGMTGFSNAATVPQAGFAAPRPALDLGLHYRHALPSSRQVDVTAFRRVNTESVASLQPDAPVYGARVELGLQPARKAGFAADRGFVGMQLQSGARISIRKKNGGPMVYYRNTF